ncbi:peptidoglycan-binding protein LysM [Aurantibacter sp.]|uniref:peptidoglycan-binding protein LysM n=1 Tax=Aurantibacter sp. TaxID=2807103 RepID=UPI0035C83FE0
MKKNKIQVLLLFVSIIALILVSVQEEPQYNTDLSLFSTKDMQLDYNLCNESNMPIIKQEKTFTPNLGQSLIAFKEVLGFKESQNDYSKVNTLGYLGKYQFGRTTLEMIGIYDTNLFLNTPELQEKAFFANTERNKWILRRDIKRFVGKRINGSVITESGILAAAHLAGPGNVKKYLRSYGKNAFSDAFGTSIKYYMKRFSGFDTSSIVPNQRPKVSLDSDLNF